MSDEIRGEGTINIAISTDFYARMLCWATHPIALELGTVEPGVPCCSQCTLYPPQSKSTE